MKSAFLFITAMVIGMSGAWAQCTPNLNLNQEGFAPPADDLDCFVQGEFLQQTIYFKNYDKMNVFGQNVQLDSIRFDSINNLPFGLYWQSNKGAVPFTAAENGCITIEGTTYDAAGTYKLDIIVTAWINGLSLPLQQSTEVIGIGYYLRVIDNANKACLPGDTTQGVMIASTGPATSVSERSIEQISTFAISPNPFKDEATVTFTATENKDLTAHLYDLSGKVLLSERLSAAEGQNRFTIHANGLSSGVYFYTLGDGKQAITHKVMILD